MRNKLTMLMVGIVAENSELMPQTGMTLLAPTQSLETELAQTEGGMVYTRESNKNTKKEMVLY